MDGYSVGNLELTIQAMENNTAKSLSTIIRRLNSLSSSLTKLEKIDISKSTANITSFFNSLNSSLSNVNQASVGYLSTISRSINTLQKSILGLTEINPVLTGKNLDVIFERIAVSVSKIDTAKIEKFASVTKSISSLTKISKIENIDFTKASQGFSQLATAIDPFIVKVKSAESALIALDNVLKKTNMSTVTKSLGGGGGSSNKSLAKTLNLAGVLGKIYFIRNYTKQMAQFMKGLVQSAIDYTETLNLWQVAMRGNIDTAEEFISKMNKAYGIAEQTLMKYQATFRNMLSTLGGVSTDVSYALSEYLTQMALDYASLYNTSIDKAMTVFQSVLSGQVRPIRSISGYDITETTIFQLYQQLGGTKTMRQLSQTEKRLLRIYAVFQQMDRSGAIGDLNKTLNNTANQMRIMSESAKELGVWIGKMIELYVAPALPYLNAFLITAKNIAQAITKALPNYSEFDGTIKGYEETAEAMDEVQGKLLDFDKFRSLSGGEQELGIGIDEKLIAGLTQYQSILENVSNKATELAEAWTSWWVGDDGKLTEQAENLLDTIKALGIAVGVLVGFKLAKWLADTATQAIYAGNSFKLLSFAVLTGAVYAIIKAVEAFKEGEIWGGILATTIGGALVIAWIALNREMLISTGSKIIAFFQTLQLQGALATTVMQKLQAAMSYLGVSIMVAVSAFTLFDSIISGLEPNARKTVSIISIVVGALGTLLGVILAIKGGLKGGLLGASIAGLGVGVLLAGIKGVASANADLADLQVRKNGGLVEDGLFTMNKGEVMGTFDDGTSIVANNQQIISGIKQGVYQAVASALQNNAMSDDRPIDIYIDGERVFQATKKNAKRHGLAFSKV